jgi:sodium pump decarboxylase gamma subunit
MAALLSQGVAWMLIGMAVVFAFLLLMIGAMSGAALFFRRHAHRFPDEPPGAAHAERGAPDGAAIAAAIAAAHAAAK